jgi:hypothetical protein
MKRTQEPLPEPRGTDAAHVQRVLGKPDLNARNDRPARNETHVRCDSDHPLPAAQGRVWSYYRSDRSGQRMLIVKPFGVIAAFTSPGCESVDPC